MSMIVTYSGIRDLSSDSESVVYEQVLADIVVATEMRFGGALGVDTFALEAAFMFNHDTKLRVFVPRKVSDQPRVARDAIRRYADEVVELGQPLTSFAYLERNATMLLGRDRVSFGAVSHRLVAFKDHRQEGGTAETIRLAETYGIPCQVVEVFSSSDPYG